MINVEQVQSHTFVEPQESDIMRFGKYRGQTIKDILAIKEMKFNKLQDTGKNYLIWCLKQDFVKQETKDMTKKYFVNL